MRYADFTDDWQSALIANGLGRALVARRAEQQQARLGRLSQTLSEGLDPLLLMQRVRHTEEYGRAPVPQAPDDVEPVFGSAVIDRDGSFEPVLLVDERIMEGAAERGTLVPTHEVRLLHPFVESLRADAGMPLPAQLPALPMPAPIPYFAPGEQASGPGTTGTFGAHVTDANGSHCILTAGHVAPRGAQVTDASGASGTVQWSNDPAAVGGPAPGADVAIVMPSAAGTASGGVSIAGTAKAVAGDGLDVRGAFTPAGATRTMGFSESLYVPSMAGMWAQVYFTTDDASQPGDSGCPVLRSGTDELVGHVVGGAPGMTSWIQSIDLQLFATACTLRPNP